MESGKQLPGRHLFAAVLTALGVTETERREAFALWNRARVKTAMVEHAADLPPKDVAFRRDESDASAVLTINYAALPGLLRTDAYQRAMSAANRWLVGEPTPGWEDRLVEEQRSRQLLLSSAEPLHLHAVLSEAALRFAVGGAEVWADQLRHLLHAGEQDNITIQVVPFDRGRVRLDERTGDDPALRGRPRDTPHRLPGAPGRQRDDRPGIGGVPVRVDVRSCGRAGLVPARVGRLHPLTAGEHEMNRPDWRKSSRSAANNACVELAIGPDSAAVRDSKHPEAGLIRFPRAGFTAFPRRL